MEKKAMGLARSCCEGRPGRPCGAGMGLEGSCNLLQTHRQTWDLCLLEGVTQE